MSPTEYDGRENIASVNWLPPANWNETAIDYYDLMLNGSNNRVTTSRVDTATSLPYYIKVSADNYTVSVTAVDVCGQRSEPSQMALNITSGSSNINRQEQQQSGVNSLVLSVLSCIAEAIIIAILVAVIIYITYKTGRCQNVTNDECDSNNSYRPAHDQNNFQNSENNLTVQDNPQAPVQNDCAQNGDVNENTDNVQNNGDQHNDAVNVSYRNEYVCKTTDTVKKLIDNFKNKAFIQNKSLTKK